MTTLDLLQRLRAAQQRSIREQELLSGRNWILVCALVHFAALLYPLFLWINLWQLHSPSVSQSIHPSVRVISMLIAAGLLLVFWWWAKYAPYRAALGALISFVLVQCAIGWLDPRQLLFGASVKALVLLGLIQAVRIGFRRHRAL
jgi:hypothetical protein